MQFSSHTGYAGWRGRAFDAGMIDDCVAGLEAIGALPRCAGLLTGYLGKAEIGEAALRALERVRAANGEAAYACDPVIGDVGRGPYVAAGRRRILPRPRRCPLATIATPNAFELEWLTGERVARFAERRGRRSRRCARAGRGSSSRSRSSSTTRRPTLSTCWPAMTRASGDCARQSCRLRSMALATCSPRCSFIIGSRRASTPEALSRAASSVYAIVAATIAAGSRELALVAAQEELARPSQIFASRGGLIQKLNRFIYFFCPSAHK